GVERAGDAAEQHGRQDDREPRPRAGRDESVGDLPGPAQQHAEAEQHEDRPGDTEGEIEQGEESGHRPSCCAGSGTRTATGKGNAIQRGRRTSPPAPRPPVSGARLRAAARTAAPTASPPKPAWTGTPRTPPWTGRRRSAARTGRA